MEPVNQPDQIPAKVKALRMERSDLIFEALKNPDNFYTNPESALDAGRGSPQSLSLARAALVGFALDSADSQCEGWSSLCELDPHGAAIAAAAFALAGDPGRSNLAFDVLTDLDLSLAAACAPAIIAKGDARLIGSALDVLKAYDLGSAQDFARKIDAKESVTLYDTQQQILNEPATKAKALPVIPAQVTALLGALRDPSLDREWMKKLLGEPRAVTTPMLAALLIRYGVDDQANEGQTGVGSAELPSMRDYLKTSESIKQLLRAESKMPHDYFLSYCMASELRRVSTEVACEFKRLAERMAANPEPKPKQPLNEFNPPLYTPPPGYAAPQIAPKALGELLQGAIAQLEQGREMPPPSALNPIFHILLAMECEEYGRPDLGAKHRERALAGCV